MKTKRKFKILFIDVIDHNIKFQSSYPCLGIGYLVAYLRKNVVDIDILVIDRNEIKQFKSFKPDAVAISSVTQNFNKAKEIAKRIKICNPRCLVIIGGVHISQIPESMDPNMDIGIIGEGEETFSQVIQHIRKSNNSLEGLETIDGLVFRAGNEIIKTKERTAIAPLDKIPHPARSILPNNENQLLLTSRGCPYKCAFCASSHYWKSLRYFSCDYILEEIEQIIRNYPVLNLTIYDDLFVYNKKRLEEISRRIVRAGYHKKVNFWCNARANHIDEESISYLKNMNVKGISVGLESGSDKVLKMIKSGNASVEINRRCIQLCKDNNIFVHGSFMLGCPYETEEDILKTYDFIKTSGIDKGDIIVATPLPGTDFWRYALKEEMVSCDMDWSKLACWHIDRLPTTEDLILLTKEIPRQRFLEHFLNIASIFSAKRKEYENKWKIVQGREIKLKQCFSLITFKKIIKDPLRGIRYIVGFLFCVYKQLTRFTIYK
jgi:radical SAM superfamily enzyme YgiQ (UPF0313 family)